MASLIPSKPVVVVVNPFLTQYLPEGIDKASKDKLAEVKAKAIAMRAYCLTQKDVSMANVMAHAVRTIVKKLS